MIGWPARQAGADEFPALARLWHGAWRDAHEAHVPAELTRRRTLDSFQDRLTGFGDALRVAGPAGAPLGLCVVRADEMYQLFVAPEARGTGAAAALLADAEARLAAAGVRKAWLDVIPENLRARRFYARQGWQERGVEEAILDTSTGPFAIRALVMVKQLRADVPD